jgi:uncharacterized protein (TIGR02246 family)
MKTLPVLIPLTAAMICTAAAQETKDPSAAITANDREYEQAYAKGDAKKLAAFFCEDAEYTSDDGQTISGLTAIEERLTQAFKLNKGAKLAIQTDSVKNITPDVLAQKGSTTVVSASGDEVTALFTAVLVKKDDGWKISQLVETPLPDVSPGEKLSGLSWLIGDWEESDSAAGVTIHSNYHWARGGNFITRNVTVKRGDDPVLEGWQIIGWDPVAEGVHSWTFDGGGGFSEGTWTNEGQRWLVRESGYTADGARTTADQTISKVADDKFYWESGNRTLDGDPQPGIGCIEIKRVKKGE